MQPQRSTDTFRMAFLLFLCHRLDLIFLNCNLGKNCEVLFTKLIIYPLSESADHCQQTKVKRRLFFVALCRTELTERSIKLVTIK